MSGVKTTDLHLSLLSFDPSLQATRTTAEHDLQQCFGLHLKKTATILDPDLLEQYAEAVYDKGAALDNCRFIRGTIRPICLPGELQRVVCNGHKRVHVLKFHSLTLRNGMIANMYEPVGKSMVHNRLQ